MGFTAHKLLIAMGLRDTIHLMRSPQRIRAALLAATVLWMAVLIGTTRLAAIPRHGANYWLTPVIYTFGRAICHQRPERSFAPWGTPMPVCARCTGVYLGALLGAVALCLGVPSRPLPASHARAMVMAAAVPTALTLVYEWTRGTMPPHVWRALAGAPLGLAVTVAIGALLLAPSTSDVQSSYTSVT
jgi:uncharacterized membrane protein